jgi:hypothetical protein
MKRLLVMFLGLILLFTPVCSARSVDEARQTLAQLKLNFDDQQFLEVIRKKDNYAVSLFLDAGMNPNLVTANSTSPLKIAAIFGNLDAVKLLLAREGIDVNWKDYWGRTATDIAYLFDNNDIVAALKEKEGTQLTVRQFSLTAAQVAQATTTGETSAMNKKDIIFAEKTMEGSGPGMAQIKAYWVTPFCALANEKLMAFRRYESVVPDRLRILANTCQVKITLPAMQSSASQNITEGLKVVGIQGGKLLHPYWIDIIPLQQTTMTVIFVPVPMYRMGIVAYFNAHDIDATKPIEIKALTKVSKEATFKFTDENGANPVYWSDEADQFNWQ